MSNLSQQIEKRRTFAIISHPDAGKTTLTEKLLLYGGAINLAGSVKGKKTARHAVSDWMEIEKQRGISVTSSVLQFRYDGYCINILDTPGHEDFSEDTYRTLMAADSAVMVIDASKGVELQTRKLFKVCVMRHIPIITFINKMDRDARNPFDLLEDIENVLGINTCPMNWPIGSGKKFKGVYDRKKERILSYTLGNGQSIAESEEISLDDPDLENKLFYGQKQTLFDDIELIEGAGNPFDIDLVRKGELTPVFFGSALTNFGVEPFLKEFLSLTTPPLPREAIVRKADQASTDSPDTVHIDPDSDIFSAFVFKIQANMNKAHRDRVAFMRICSGRFEKNMEVYHVQSGRSIRVSQPQSLMAQEREIIEEAYAGDILGVFDPGVFSIGDTIVAPQKNFAFKGIPTFAPEHFATVRIKDTMRRKQFVKGMNQIAQEGAIQIFHSPDTGMEEVIVGVVGTLQFDVLKYRMQSEYNTEIILTSTPFQYIRWITSDVADYKSLDLASDTKVVADFRDNLLLLFRSDWSITWALEHNKELELQDFSTAE